MNILVSIKSRRKDKVVVIQNPLDICAREVFKEANYPFFRINKEEVNNMKISEKLSEIKQKEGQLLRLYNLRDTFAKQSFKDTFLSVEKPSAEELKKKQEEFIKNKAKKFESITKDIEILKKEIVEDKNKINRKNVKKGIDLKLAEMKYLRLELSKLMNLIKGSSILNERIDIDVWEELGVAKRIGELETNKSRIDGEIQKVNWATDL